jgi:hypothetical protein
MMKQVALLVIVAMVLMGCASGVEYTDYAQSIDSSNRSGQSALIAYFNKKSIDNQNIFKALGQSNDPAQAQNNQMAIVLYTILSQQNDEKVLQHFTPKYADKPTTNADIGVSLANNFLPTLVRWGAGAWLGGKVVDGLQTTSTVLGAGATLTNQNAGGSISGGPTGAVSNTDNSMPVDNTSTTSSSSSTSGNYSPLGGDNNYQPTETLDESVF